MRFTFTMNMPSHSGNPVHQIHGDHPAKSLDELLKVIASSDFIMVDEFYIKKDHNSGRAFLDPQQLIALNPMHIGKIKPMQGDLAEG